MFIIWKSITKFREINNEQNGEENKNIKKEDILLAKLKKKIYI